MTCRFRLDEASIQALAIIWVGYGTILCLGRFKIKDDSSYLLIGLASPRGL